MSHSTQNATLTLNENSYTEVRRSIAHENTGDCNVYDVTTQRKRRGWGNTDRQHYHGEPSNTQLVSRRNLARMYFPLILRATHLWACNYISNCNCVGWIRHTEMDIEIGFSNWKNDFPGKQFGILDHFGSQEWTEKVLKISMAPIMWRPDLYTTLTRS